MISLFRDITSICRKKVDLRITKATTLFHALIISLHDCKNIYIFINYVIRVFEEKPRYICTIWTFASMIKLRYILFVFYFHIWKISNSLFHCVLFSLKKIKLGQFRDRHRVVKVARVGWNCWFVSRIVVKFILQVSFSSRIIIYLRRDDVSINEHRSNRSNRTVCESRAIVEKCVLTVKTTDIGRGDWYWRWCNVSSEWRTSFDQR